MRPGRQAAALVLAASLAAGLLGCSAAARGGGADRTLTVFAAASLKASFTRLAGEFELRNPGVKVRLSFAGSSELAAQITRAPRRTSSPRPTPRTWPSSRTPR